MGCRTSKEWETVDKPVGVSRKEVCGEGVGCDFGRNQVSPCVRRYDPELVSLCLVRGFEERQGSSSP